MPRAVRKCKQEALCGSFWALCLDGVPSSSLDEAALVPVIEKNIVVICVCLATIIPLRLLRSTPVAFVDSEAGMGDLRKILGHRTHSESFGSLDMDPAPQPFRATQEYQGQASGH